MKKRDWIISIISGLVLGLIISAFSAPSIGLIERANAAQDGEVTAILNLVLNSHTKWQSVQGEATVTWFGPDGTQQEYVQTFKVSQPILARFETTLSPIELSSDLWVSDGEEVFEANTKDKSYTASSLPDFASNYDLLPASVTEVSDEEIYHFPFALLIPSPLAEYIYPHWFAQGHKGGTYTLAGEETLLQRKVWLMYYEVREHHIVAWIDQETGVILRFIHEIEGQAQVEMNMISIAFDKELDEDDFAIPPDFDRIELPDESS